MTGPARLFAAAFLVLSALLPAAASADDLNATDRTAIQSLITAQIDAFRQDNGAAAYSYASPTVHAIFPTVDEFMAMVKGGYQPVYRPQSVTFGALDQSDSGPVQKVYVTGPDGQGYVAVYALQRQPDGTWKINGCSLARDDSPSI